MWIDIEESYLHLRMSMIRQGQSLALLVRPRSHLCSPILMPPATSNSLSLAASPLLCSCPLHSHPLCLTQHQPSLAATISCSCSLPCNDPSCLRLGQHSSLTQPAFCEALLQSCSFLHPEVNSPHNLRKLLSLAITSDASAKLAVHHIMEEHNFSPSLLKQILTGVFICWDSWKLFDCIYYLELMA